MSYSTSIKVDRGSRDWLRMWTMLGMHILANGLGDGDDLDQPDDRGECWSYQGTLRNSFADVHQFRHRNHPKTMRREWIDVSIDRVGELA